MNFEYFTLTQLVKLIIVLVFELMNLSYFRCYEFTTDKVFDSSSKKIS